MKTLKMLGYEEQVLDAINEDLVAKCETVVELIDCLDVILNVDIPHVAIETVAKECWNDYQKEFV